MAVDETVKARTELPNSLNLSYIENVYTQYVRDPLSVSPEWRQYFMSFSQYGRSMSSTKLGPTFHPASIFNPAGKNGQIEHVEDRVAALQDRVSQVIRNYRVRGHVIARVDPLGGARPTVPELESEFYGFTQRDMERRFYCETLHCDGLLSLQEILERLRQTYCRSIGVQFMHIDDLAARAWLQERMETTQNRVQLSPEQQQRVFIKLTDAVIFEEFIQKKFLGAKSFSLEGGESLIPLLDLAIEKAAEQGIEEIVLGMAHRGRLNVLTNVVGKAPREIFREFEDKDAETYAGQGDVKYHLGYYNIYTTMAGKEVYLALSFNPSHLEFVNPVALGRMRAKQDRVGDIERSRGMVLLIHGDAAFAGEGIVQETLNLSQLEAYTTGGTLHVVINNQLGFTTGPAEARSSLYATDVARMLQIPIFHVNGEDPEAVAQTVGLAMDFRREFKRDVVIDMYCFRRRGHNETDEPSFTQPLMYRAIQRRASVHDTYCDRLLALGSLRREQAEEIAAGRREKLETELSVARQQPARAPDKLGGIWNKYHGGPEENVAESDTRVDRERLVAFLDALTKLPQDFHPHAKIMRGLRARREMAQGKIPLDWSTAEALAFATLATEGVRVRFSGQDSARGTFSQRHAVLHDIEDGHTYVPLKHLSSEQAPVEIYNSPLSEAGVLGFEYGYSVGCPDGLVIWEAQFGDFVNAAQVFVDQFIASAETKWNRLSGLVLLLPHGLEGLGPEHSSARLERFLELTVDGNIQIVCPTTPAQYFHCLRRQVLRRWRKPLVVMTPKSLLRHPRAVSALEELSQGSFQRLIPDAVSADAPERVILCSGKIFYELEQKRSELNRSGVPILRLEQLYPLKLDHLHAVLDPYPDGTPVYWVQEEPKNMGAWSYLRMNFGEKLFDRFPFSCVSRPPSASPATGSGSRHKREQTSLLEAAFLGA